MNVFANANGVVVTRKGKGYFKSGDVEGEVGRLLGGAGAGVEVGSTHELQKALAGVLNFVGVGGDSKNHGRFRWEAYHPATYMRVDAAAQKALNVLKSKTDANDSFSMYGLMDKVRFDAV